MVRCKRCSTTSCQHCVICEERIPTPRCRSQEQLIHQSSENCGWDIRQCSDGCICSSRGLGSPDGYDHEASTDVAGGIGGDWTEKSDQEKIRTCGARLTCGRRVSPNCNGAVERLILSEGRIMIRTMPSRRAKVRPLVEPSGLWGQGSPK